MMLGAVKLKVAGKAMTFDLSEDCWRVDNYHQQAGSGESASFIAEIVRAGILAVSHGQTEAAYSVGLRPGPTLRLVVIPQAMRVIIPPLTSQYLNLTKNSSLAAAIAYPDLVLVFAGTVLMQTGQAVEVIAMTMAVYLTFSLLISAFMNWYNKKIALVER